LIPLRDENPTRITPVVVIGLIALNVIVFAIDSLGARDHTGALAQLALVPANIINVFHGESTIAPAIHPVWLTIFTSMFMHANLLHIGGNMLYLWIFGNNIEDTLGHVKFLFFYLAGGAASAFAHILSTAGDPRMAAVPTVGASGAIAAVLGAYLILFPSARVVCLVTFGYFITTARVPAVVVLLLWIGMQFISVSIGGYGAASGGVAYWAHIGGFVTGILLILLLAGRRRSGRSDRNPYPEWRR
jgi:membrane associated rhomboid family serine protease